MRERGARRVVARPWPKGRRQTVGRSAAGSVAAWIVGKLSLVGLAVKKWAWTGMVLALLLTLMMVAPGTTSDSESTDNAACNGRRRGQGQGAARR